MKAVVIYKSKTGFAARYAKWIALKLGAEAVPYDRRRSISLDGYDAVIFGCGIYAGRLNGANWFKKVLPSLSGKKLAVFAVGANPPESGAGQKAVERAFPRERFGRVKTFYFQGGLDYEHMNAKDRLMMKGLQTMLKSKGESEALEMVSKSFDTCSEDTVQPLVDFMLG